MIYTYVPHVIMFSCFSLLKFKVQASTLRAHSVSFFFFLFKSEKTDNTTTGQFWILLCLYGNSPTIWLNLTEKCPQLDSRAEISLRPLVKSLIMLSVLSVSRAVDTGTQSLHRLFLLCNTVQWTSDYVSPRLYPRRYWNAWRHWKPAQNISATRTSRCTWENTGRTKSTVLYFFYCLETIKECSTVTHPRPSPTHHGSQLQAATDQAILTEQQQQRIRMTIWLKVYVKGCISPNEKQNPRNICWKKTFFYLYS